MPASAKRNSQDRPEAAIMLQEPTVGGVSLQVPNSERGEREAESVMPRVRKGSELAW